MKNPIIKRIIWILIFAVLFYTAFVVWSDARKNVETLRQFPWRHLPLILGAVLMNLWIRELKWDYFRRIAGIRVPRIGSFLVFFSGYSMCISPGRVGELIKPFMYKEYFDQKMRRTVPLVFCERLSDLLGMIVLAGVALSGFARAVQSHNDQGWLSSSFIYGFLIFSAAFMVALVWVLRQKRWFYGLLFALGRVGPLRKIMHKMRKVYYATYPLLTIRNLTITTGLAAFSWSFECLTLYWILHGVGATSVTFSQATFIFCMATIFGGFLFFLPGGIGGFEATMAIMLSILGVPPYQSAPAVILIRFCTLFFSVALGFLFILMTSLKYHKGLEWEEFEHAGSETM